ncbi:hypothetical protein [Lacticaseibacillus casei]|uniref:DUF1642 domain-containing protein n=1 Tax=Lacticaseibacillus casei TaxID=1582 RepID=A0ABZ0BZH9_LACCA|nr:hypothetical protein [Lacticaseibacillus casei]UZV40674.1 hypothetical protein [Lacticaseibacillus phage C3.1]WBM89645.1 hypothetical protein [Lacticaseibacillus phage C4.1]KAB1969314.1 hypothetical protein F9B82_10475 [Lacticaseibacillus casei]WNX25508.1 hypothetical protein RWA15_03920 [Lacticaseibacillus casei]WNX28278.1 hypothetical protein RWA16_03920 [Lacticaseibacillus casei]
MSNETKRDVLEDLVEELANAYIALDGEGIGEDLTNEDKQDYLKDYDNALPDDLPVIPEAVGEILRSAHGQDNLLGVLDTAKNGHKISEPLAWVIANQNTFASAWILGVWRVEETGEVTSYDD